MTVATAAEAPAAALSGTAVLHRRVLTNTLAQLVAPLVRMATGVVLTGVLSRALGVTAFGEYALVFAYVAVFGGVFNDWGLATICVREISRYPDRTAEIVGSAAGLQAVIATASYGLMLVTLLFLPYPQPVRFAVALYGLTFFLSPLDLLALPFQANLQLARLIHPNLFGTVSHILLTLLAIWAGAPLLLLVGAALAALLAQYAWLTWLSLRDQRLALRVSTAQWRPLLGEAWPLAVALVFSTLFRQGPLLALSLGSIQAVGLFNAANRVPQQLLLLPNIIRVSAFPLLSRSWLHHRKEYPLLVERLVAGSLLLAVPAAVFGIALAEPLTRALFGPDFAGAAWPFAILMATLILVFPGSLTGEAMVAAGFQRLNLFVLAAACAVLAAMLYLLVPAAGAAGACLALLLSYAFIVVATFACASRFAGVTTPAGILLRAMLSTAAGLALAYISQPLGQLPTAVLGTAVAATTFAATQPQLLRLFLAMLRPQRQAAPVGPAASSVGQEP